METGGEDRISALPDCLIHHILSFLDMVYVVQTSILSTRWRYLWTSVPVLNFKPPEFYVATGRWAGVEDEVGEEDEVRFVIEGFCDFVDKVLFSHDNSDIQTFALVDNHPFEELHMFSSWIHVLLQHNVQEVNLVLGYAGFVEIPDCLFTCESLITLRLSVIAFYGSPFIPPPLHLPDSIRLPTLKTFHFEGVSFKDETLISRLFSSSPLLESLTLENCKIDYLEKLIIDAPRLQHLDISLDQYDDGRPAYGESYTSYVTKIMIYAPNLKSFECHYPMERVHYLCHCSSLEKATVYIKIYSNTENAEEEAEKEAIYGHRLTQFLKEVSSVQSLTIQKHSQPPAGLESLTFRFHNLRYLNLWAYFTRPQIIELMYLLDVSPILETLIIGKYQDYCCDECPEKPSKQYPEDLNSHEDEPDHEKMGKSWEDLLSSQHMLHHLKFVEIHYVHCCAKELKFLEVLLEAALVMEKMSVFTSTVQREHLDIERRLIKFSEKLLMATRASPNLEIFFI